MRQPAVGDLLAHAQPLATFDLRKVGTCVELLMVRGWANKDVATELDLSEQQVANYKFDFLARLRNHVRQQGLSEDVFPELYQTT